MNAAPNLATCSAAYWSAYARGYGDGCLRGYETHRAEIEAADQAMWAACSRKVRAQANSPRYAQLCDRRGEPHRAARARINERRIGLPVIL